MLQAIAARAKAEAAKVKHAVGQAVGEIIDDAKVAAADFKEYRGDDDDDDAWSEDEDDAISDGELTPTIVDAAAPLRNAFGVVVGAIAVGARKSRIKDRYQALGSLVRESAEALSWELGWRPPA